MVTRQKRMSTMKSRLSKMKGGDICGRRLKVDEVTARRHKRRKDGNRADIESQITHSKKILSCAFSWPSLDQALTVDLRQSLVSPYDCRQSLQVVIEWEL
jgi:hypothetical protein